MDSISLIAAGIWSGSLVASLVAILIGAAVSRKGGTTSAEIVVMLLLATAVVFFIAGAIFVHKTGERTVAGQRAVSIFQTRLLGTPSF